MAIKDAAVLQDPKSRFNMMIVGGIALVMIIFAFLLFGGHKKQAGPVAAGGTFNGAQGTNAEKVPNTSTSTAFNALQEDDNKQRAENALKNTNTNSAVVPVLTNQAAPIDFAQTGRTRLPTAPNQNTVVPEQTVVPVRPAQQATQYQQPQQPQQNQSQNQQVDQSALRVQEDIKKRMEDASKSMDDRVKFFLANSDPSPGYAEVAYKKDPATPEKDAKAAAAGAGSAAGAAASTPTVLPRIAYAGDILPAVLINGVNTDYKGPVLGRVVGGPLDRSVVRGEYQASYEGVVIHFTSLSSPNYPQALAIDAYAISPETSMYGITGSVDHHYLQNLGYVFGAALIQGYGQAVSRQNTTVTTDALGGTTSSQGSLNNSQLFESALGTGGQAIGQKLSQQADRPTTITVDARDVVGLLLTSDLTASR